ncbi:MAG: HYR domain-containing protein [bacterium]|nr:HYR domain-containing protein [bacterium]
MQTYAIRITCIAVVLLLFGNASYVHAADPLSSTQSPTAAANVGTTGTGWSASTIARALVVDGSETKLTNALPANGTSMLLVLTGFNFNIPVGATITGVAVSVTRRSTSSSGEFVRDATIELVGTFGTSSSLASADAWPATHAAVSYGGSTTLWGAALTPADISAANFGLAIAAQNTDPDAAHNAHVDGATVTVYYTESDTTPPSIAAMSDLPGNEAASAAGVAVSFELPAASDEGGIASESCDPGSGSTFAIGTTTVTCTATDTAGNSASVHFDIGVVDTTPPVVAPTGSGALVWGNADGTNPQQITLEDGGTYAVSFNTAAPAYIMTTAAGPVIGILFYIDTSGESPVRQSVATMYLHNDSGDESLAWGAAGSYELDILEPPLPQMVNVRMKWIARLLFADVAEAFMAPPGPVLETLHFTIQEAPTPCATDCFSNVLFLPGIEASRLYRPSVVGAPERQVWEPPLLGHDNMQLAMAADGTPVNSDVYTKDTLESALGVDLYGSFISSMQQLADARTITFEAFPYDWRYAADIVASNPTQRATTTIALVDEIKRLAAASKTGKVTIVAHSNGGRVAKEAMLQFGADAAKYVDKLIFVAVPQVGTPQAVAALLHGYRQGIPVSWAPLLISDAESRTLAQNMPGAYGLLPTAAYFSLVNTPVVTFSTSDLATQYGNTITSQSSLDAFLTDAGRTAPAANDLNSPTILRSGILSQSRTMHQDIDAWTPPDGVELIQIAGWGVPTTVSGIDYKQFFDFRKETFVTVPNPNFTIDGDGTVVVPSALWVSTGAGVANYWVDLSTYNRVLTKTSNGRLLDLKHSTIFSIDELQQFISDLLTNTSNPLGSYKYLSTESPFSTQVRLRFALHSPLTLDLFDDQGRHTGISTTTNEVEENIPGTYYVQFGDVKYIFADSGTPQHIIMSGYDTGTFTLEVGEFLGNNETVSTTFADVPVTPQTQVTFTVTSGLASASNLSVDENGDGTVDSTYASSTGQIIVPVSVEAQTTPASSGGGGGISSFLPQAISTTTATTAATSTEVVHVPKQEIATTSTPSVSLPQPKKTVQASIKTPIKKKPVVVATSTNNAPAQSSQVASAAQSTGGGLWSRLWRWIMNGISSIIKI